MQRNMVSSFPPCIIASSSSPLPPISPAYDKQRLPCMAHALNTVPRRMAARLCVGPTGLLSRFFFIFSPGRMEASSGMPHMWKVWQRTLRMPVYESEHLQTDDGCRRSFAWRTHRKVGKYLRPRKSIHPQSFFWLPPSTFSPLLFSTSWQVKAVFGEGDDIGELDRVTHMQVKQCKYFCQELYFTHSE